MHIISSTDSWDLHTRQIDIGLLVSATNSATATTGSATIAINGQTVATGVTVANTATDNETLDPIGADKDSLTITSIYANIRATDAPITVTVTAEETGADLLWCYAHSTSVPYVAINEDQTLSYATVANTKPRHFGDTPVNIPALNPIGNVELGGWRTINSGANVTVDVTTMLGNLAVI